MSDGARVSRDLLINLLTLRRSRAGGAESVATELMPRLFDRWPGRRSTALVRDSEVDWLQGLGWPRDVLQPIKAIGRGSSSVPLTGLAASRVAARHDGVVLSPFNTHTIGARPDREVVVVQDFLRLHYLAGTWGPLPRAERAVIEVKALALKRAAQRAAAVVVHTEAVRDDAIRFLPALDPRRIHVVPLGADRGHHPFAADPTPTLTGEARDPHRSSSSIHGPYVLVVGSSTARHKNLDLAIKMAATPTFRALEATLVMVGRVVPELPLGTTAPIRQLQDISDAQLRDLYENCSCLVFPSASEGFGLPLAEAMGMGVPCVASDIPIFRELAGDAARFFDPTSPEAAADAVASTLLDADAAEARGAKGAARALERYTWDISATGYLRVLESVLDGR